MPRGPYMTEAEKTEIWDRHRRGEPLYVIARQIGRSLEGVRRQVNRSGGVRPEPRRRPRGALSAEEREEISRGLARKDSYRAIGARIGRPHSTVLREVKRNGGRKRYRAAEADVASVSDRPKPARTNRVKTGHLR